MRWKHNARNSYGKWSSSIEPKFRLEPGAAKRIGSQSVLKESQRGLELDQATS
jgi:hypothetical protein